MISQQDLDTIKGEVRAFDARRNTLHPDAARLLEFVHVLGKNLHIALAEREKLTKLISAMSPQVASIEEADAGSILQGLVMASEELARLREFEASMKGEVEIGAAFFEDQPVGGPIPPSDIEPARVFFPLDDGESANLVMDGGHISAIEATDRGTLKRATWNPNAGDFSPFETVSFTTENL